MTDGLTICIRFRGFWRVGTGEGRVGGVDMLTARDADGLPYVPGRHIKGILREAVRAACEYGWIAKDDDDRIFGKRLVVNGGAGISSGLRFEDAQMAVFERAAIAGAGPEIKAQLFRQRHKTAIGNSGTALRASLRNEEVVIPLTLYSKVIQPGQTGPSGWKQVIKETLPLIRAMGGGRTRGLGRCQVTGVADAGGSP